jgi:hypothetical protein
LSGEFKEGDTVLVDLAEDELTFKVKGKSSARNQSKEKKG